MPPRHPLFSTMPPKEIIFDVIEKLGIHTQQVFTRDQLELNTAADIIGLLEPYYFHCKSAELFSDLNEKRLITILRQCLKIHGYTLKGRETTRNGRKVVNYIIAKEEADQLDEPIVVSFI
jgi:hypothetical protein